jgi:hypothetical protein
MGGSPAGNRISSEKKRVFVSVYRRVGFFLALARRLHLLPYVAVRRCSPSPPRPHRLFVRFSSWQAKELTMRRLSSLVLAICAIAVTATSAQAQLAPLSGFGTGGWLAPGAIPQLDTSNSQRGMAVVPTTGNIVLVDRDSTLGNNAYVLDGTTGAVTGTLTPPVGGYAGGTFVVNGAGAGTDGSIHVGNLVTSTASTFKVYSWASDSDFTTPATTSFSLAMSDPSWGGVNRVGDVFAATGSGSAVKWASSGSNSAAGTNSTFSVGTVNGTNTQTTYTAVPGTATASNGYRLGLSFIDSTSLIGTQGTELYTTDFSSSPTVQAGTISAAQRPVAYLNHAGIAYMATIDTNSSNVSVYNIQDPLNPVSLFTGNNTTGALSANANGTGGIGWGPSLGGDQYVLYAMSTNQGIQGFVATVPEPASFALLAVGAGAFQVIRRRRAAA